MCLFLCERFTYKSCVYMIYRVDFVVGQSSQPHHTSRILQNDPEKQTNQRHNHDPQQDLSDRDNCRFFIRRFYRNGHG